MSLNYSASHWRPLEKIVTMRTMFAIWLLIILPAFRSEGEEITPPSEVADTPPAEASGE